MNLLDMLSISPHYFCRKWIGATNENSNFDLKVYRSKGGFRRAYKRRDISEGVDNQNRKSASKQAAAVLIKIRFTCTGVCPIMISCWCIINNGNWTEWSAIWSEIIRVVSKSNERVARVRFEITNMISDQNCTTRSSITTLLRPFWNRRI